MINKLVSQGYAILCVIVFSLFIGGCEKDVVYTLDEVHFIDTDFDACEVEQCPEFEVTIKKIGTPAIAKAIVNPWITDNVIKMIYRDEALKPKTVEDAISYYINDSQTAYPEDSVHSETHELTIDVGPSFATNKLLSVVFYGHKFDGGAHGYSVEKYLNLNPRTGTIYALEDLVTDNFYAFAKADYEQKTTDETYLFIIAEPKLAAIGFNAEGLLLAFSEEDDQSMKGTVVFHPLSWEAAAPYLKVELL